MLVGVFRLAEIGVRSFAKFCDTGHSFCVAVNCVVMWCCARMSEYRVIDDVKQKILAFLLHSAQDLLVTAGCPISKVTIND